jgi:2-polyprenyl-3-methyl-5-hydroxy-6-metoxy-1,4-benzoquinol methylase
VVVDERMRRHYELNDESARLWESPRGDLTRLRTWDIFDRFLPPSGRIADVGGGPGTHAAHLAALGYDVMLVDSVPRHVGGTPASVRSSAMHASFPSRTAPSTRSSSWGRFTTSRLLRIAPARCVRHVGCCAPAAGCSLRPSTVMRG